MDRRVSNGIRRVSRQAEQTQDLAAGAQPDDDGVDFRRSTARPSW